MSNYTKSTNFATKDNLSPGDPLKIVRGTEIDTEFNNISTAISTKTDNSAAAITGGSISGITDLAIADGGTGASTATAALNNLLPSQTGNSSKYLQTDGTNATWDAISINTGDITGTLPVANGGTGITSFGTGIATFLGTPSSANLASAVTDETGSGALVFANTPTLVAPILGTPTSGNFSSGSFTWPTFNQNTTGTAAGLSATLAIASGGTGQTTANAAFNALAPSQTSASGKYLKSDGTNTSWDALDISTADITGTLPVANGGTGVTSSTGTGSVVLSNSPTLVTPILGTPQSGNFSTGTFTWPTFNQNTTGTAAGLSATLATTSGGTGLTSLTSGGVVYASSTSALATGSALTFDGSQLAVNTSSNGIPLLVNGTGNTGLRIAGGTGAGLGSYLSLQAQGGNAALISTEAAITGSGTSTNLMLYGYGSNSIIFAPATAEAMRLTSTSLYTASGINVGIGTSSPAYKLDVQGGASSFATSGGYQFYWQRTGISKQFGFSSDSSGTYLNNVTDSVTGILQISNSGNLGLGATPSAWGGSFKALQVGDRSAIVNVSNSTILSSNYFNDGTGDKFILSAGASVYQQIGGDHRWLTTQSTQGVGNPISFTQAMTLSATGNLSIGTTAQPMRQNVYGTNNNTVSGANIWNYNIVGINIRNESTTANTMAGLYLEGGAGNSASAIFNIQESSSLGALGFATGGSGVSGGSVPERMRIDSSGNLLVGTTDASVGTGAGFKVLGGRPVVTNAQSTDGGATVYEAYSTGAGAYRFYVGMGGTVFATSIVISAISDQRLKENVRDIETGLDAIMALKPRRFDWKEGKGQDKKNVAGFIAQEFETVFPECVGVSRAGEDGIEYKNINHETLIPTLVKAIQELKAEFDAYKASHP